MIKNAGDDLLDDENINFQTNFKNTLYIQYNSPVSVRDLSKKISSKDVHLLTPAKEGLKTLFFCHFPEKNIKTRGDFEKLILQFVNNKTLKIKAFIAEKVFSVFFESEDDCKRVATFVPNIDFGPDESESQEDEDKEEEEEEYNSENVLKTEHHIFVGSSWFEMPIIRFSNIPIDVSQAKFKKLEYIRDTVFCQFQKNKTSNKTKTFQNIHVIAKSLKQANDIISLYNFGSFKNEMAYVNWFVDSDVLEKLEKYKIKVYLTKEEEANHIIETDFYKKMSEYGRVFSVTLCHSNKSNTNEDDDDDQDFDENDSDDDSEINSNNESNNNKDKESTASFGNVIFVDKNAISKVQEDYKIEYWFASGMIYNFPFETSVDDVGEYLKEYSKQILSIELKNADKIKNDNKILPYFFITFDTVDSLEIVLQYIEKHPYQAKNQKCRMQPFLIPREKNLPSTIQKYNLHRDLLLKSNTILVENLTSECSSSSLIDLFADCGIIMLIKIDNKDLITANLTFSDETDMEKAIDVNGSYFNGKVLNVTQYIFPNDNNNNNNNNNANNNAKKKKKKKNKNTHNDINDDDTNNSKIKVSRKDNQNKNGTIATNNNTKNANQNNKNWQHNQQRKKGDNLRNDVNNKNGNNARNQRGGYNAGNRGGRDNSSENRQKRGSRGGRRGRGNRGRANNNVNNSNRDYYQNSTSDDNIDYEYF